MNITIKQKRMMVKLRKEGYGDTQISKTIGCSRAVVKKYLTLYSVYGEEGLLKFKCKKRYPNTLKLEVIERVNNGEAMNKIALEKKIHVQTVYKWVALFRQFGYNHFLALGENEMKKKNKQKAVNSNNKPNHTTKKIDLSKDDYKTLLKEFKELKKQNERLKIEVEILKKLNALIQKSETKSKK